MVWIYIVGIIVLLCITNKFNNKSLNTLLYILIPLVGILIEYIEVLSLKNKLIMGDLYFFNEFTKTISIFLRDYIAMYAMSVLMINKIMKIIISKTKKMGLYFSVLLAISIWIIGNTPISTEPTYEQFMNNFYMDIPVIIIVSLLIVYITNQFMVLFQNIKNNKNYE